MPRRPPSVAAPSGHAARTRCCCEATEKVRRSTREIPLHADCACVRSRNAQCGLGRPTALVAQEMGSPARVLLEARGMPY
jgi:hypothetical protein